MSDQDEKDAQWLDVACEKAALNESSAGAVLVKGETLIARGHHCCEAENNPIATAEMDCIRHAGRRNDQPDLILYTTQQPDLLCAGTVIQFGIGEVVVGLPEAGGEGVNLLRARGVPIRFAPHDGCEKLPKSWKSA